MMTYKQNLINNNKKSRITTIRHVCVCGIILVSLNGKTERASAEKQIVLDVVSQTSSEKSSSPEFQVRTDLIEQYETAPQNKVSIITTNWGTSPVSFDEITGVLTVSSGTLSTSNNDGTISGVISRQDVKSIVFEEGVSAPENSDDLFSFFYNLKNIQGSLDTSNTISMASMFFDCEELTSLDLSSFNTSQVTSMAGMFFGCKNLTSLNVSSFNTSKVTNMGSMFGSCNNLTSLDVSSFNTAEVTNMKSMFGNCNSLLSLDVSSFDTSKVTNMEKLFVNCSSLTSLNLSSFSTFNVNNSIGMFTQCIKLTSIKLGEKSYFLSSYTDLPKIDTSNGVYSGKWERIVPKYPKSIYESSKDFMGKYDGTYSGTYIWQVVTSTEPTESETESTETASESTESETEITESQIESEPESTESTGTESTESTVSTVSEGASTEHETESTENEAAATTAETETKSTTESIGGSETDKKPDKPTKLSGVLPQTGEKYLVWLSGLGASLICVVGLVFYKRRQ